MQKMPTGCSENKKSLRFKERDIISTNFEKRSLITFKKKIDYSKNCWVIATTIYCYL